MKETTQEIPIACFQSNPRAGDREGGPVDPLINSEPCSGGGPEQISEQIWRGKGVLQNELGNEFPISTSIKQVPSSLVFLLLVLAINFPSPENIPPPPKFWEFGWPSTINYPPKFPLPQKFDEFGFPKGGINSKS